jgi:hypothetical protein
MAVSSAVWCGSWTAKTSATDSATSRRAAKENAWAEARSSHCASSTTHSKDWSRDLSQQAEDGQSHQKPVGRVAALEPERGEQRVALRCGQPLDAIRHPTPQLMQPGVGQFHLGLDTGRARDSEPGRLVNDVLQQLCLADPWLTAHDEGPAFARPDIGEQLVERLALANPVQQHVAPLTHHHFLGKYPGWRTRHTEPGPEITRA